MAKTRTSRAKAPKAVEPTAKETVKVVEKVIEKAVVIDRAVLDARSRSLMDPAPHDVLEQAAKLVLREKQAYEDSNRLIKNTMTRAYKNYLGIFDEPYDPYTGRKKVFTPLTHNTVDAVSKGVSVTSRSVRIKPKNAESRGAAKLMNMVLPYFFQEMDFDGMMRKFTHRTAWLGTQVTVQDWLYRETAKGDGKDADTKQMNGAPKEEETDEKPMKVVEDRPRITMLNVHDLFLPSRSESLPWAVRNASVILRAQMPLSDLQSNPRYSEKARAKMQGYFTVSEDENDATALNKYAGAGYRNAAKVSSGQSAETNSVPQSTVYTRFGKVPLSWITEKDEDALKLADGIIECASDSSSGSDLVCLSVRLSPFGEYGPFEDARFNVVPERYFGEGVGERLIPLQAWHNEVVNNRRNNEVLVQHRMYKYKKGAVDTKQFFARPGGGIALDNMDDVQPLDIGDVKQSSFAEDQNIEQMAQRMTGTVMTPVTKSMSATEASGIQVQQAITANELKITIEGYMERLVLNHLIPLIRRYFKQKRAIPVRIPMSELEVLDSYNGYAPWKSRQMGEERFIYMDSSSVLDGDFDVTVEIDDSMQSNVQKANALVSAISLGAKIENSGLNIQASFRKLLELQGIVDDRLFESAEAARPTGVTNPVMGGMPEPQAVPAAPAAMPQGMEEAMGRMGI